MGKYDKVIIKYPKLDEDVEEAIRQCTLKGYSVGDEVSYTVSQEDLDAIKVIEKALSDKDKKIDAIEYQRTLCYEQIDELQSKLNAIEEALHEYYQTYNADELEQSLAKILKGKIK